MLFPTASFPDAPHLETRKALLLIDLQHDFVHTDGKLHVKNTAGFLPKLPGLVSKFRETGAIIWAQSYFAEPQATLLPGFGSYVIVLQDFIEAGEGNDFDPQTAQAAPPPDDATAAENTDPGAQDPEAFLAARSPESSIPRCCLPDSIGVRLPESLAAAVDPEKDLTLLKRHYSAFHDASFLMTLRKRFITELYLCGSLSNISVYATALDAVRHGMSVTIIEDCVGYRNEKCHEEAMRQMADAMGANGVDCQELIDDLNGDLGDVVTEDTFPTRFDVQLSNARSPSDDSQLRPRVQEWMSSLDAIPSESSDRVLESVEGRQEPAGSYEFAPIPEADLRRHLGLMKGGLKHLRDEDAQPARRTTEAASSESHIPPEPSAKRPETLHEDTTTSLSPPRKRSTGDLDFEEQVAKSTHTSRHRRLSHDTTPHTSQPRAKTNRTRVRRRQPRNDAGASAATSRPATTSTEVTNAEPTVAAVEAQSMPNLSVTSGTQAGNDPSPATSMPNLALADTAPLRMELEGEGARKPSGAQAEAQMGTCSLAASRSESRRDLDPQWQENEAPMPSSSLDTLRAELRRDLESQWLVSEEESGVSSTAGPEIRHDLGKSATQPIDVVETYGEGDSHIVCDLVVSQDARQAFSKLKNEVQWQKMYHRSGEVPRLVAVQGQISPDGCIPVYRHPSDKSPRLRQFTRLLQSLREDVEKVLRHPVNHVLIQLYRSGEDNISEHSDKTLDIVRGSNVVNLSLGAQRTMILRAKKSASTTLLSASETTQRRQKLRIPLPHNSLFILGPKTNQYWLHSIRADKRREAEKSPEELAFDGERISLTFRHVGTFIDPREGTIWGQGATQKEMRFAKRILSGPQADQAGEMMIRAFGQENHRSHDFDWQEVYGEGFDVIDFTTREMPAAA